MPSEFRWNDWNLEHTTKHGVPPEESEHVVRFAARLVFVTHVEVEER